MDANGNISPRVSNDTSINNANRDSGELTDSTQQDNNNLIYTLEEEKVVKKRETLAVPDV